MIRAPHEGHCGSDKGTAEEAKDAHYIGDNDIKLVNGNLTAT